MAKKFSPEELEQKLAAKLTMSALNGDGSTSAARQVLDILDRIRSREAAEEHRRRMEELAEKPVEMARYLGYLGEGPREIEEALGAPVDGRGAGGAGRGEEAEATRAASGRARGSRAREGEAGSLDAPLRSRPAMPCKPPTPCAHPGCPTLTHSRHCQAHRARARPKTAARGYGSRWRRIRARKLHLDPWCEI